MSPTLRYYVDLNDTHKLDTTCLYSAIDFLVKNTITSQIDVNSIKVLHYDIISCDAQMASALYVHKFIVQFHIDDKRHETAVFLKYRPGITGGSISIFYAVMDGDYDLLAGAKIGERYLGLAGGKGRN